MNCTPPAGSDLLRTAALGVGLLLLPLTLPAQSTSSPPGASAGEVVKLSEFNVSAEKDVGYSTTNAIGVTRTNTPIIDTPQAVNVINQEFLRDAAAGELYDVLKYISGISIEANVGDSVMIRGYTVRGQYTDGLADNQNQTQAGAEPFLYERLEVLKGPAALVYGSHATGGVLNRVRKSPAWKAGGEAGFTVGNHAQYKGELDYTAPLNDQFAYRLVGIYREEDLSNGVNTRHSWFERWNLDPMVTWRPTEKLQVKVVGEFMNERGFKHWGESAALQPFGLNSSTTFGRLPQDFTFGDPWAISENDKKAYWGAVEAQVTADWSLRLAGYSNNWNHEVYDIFQAGIQANNTLMNRTGRFISNYDYNLTYALDSVLNFRLGPSDHKFLMIAQHYEQDNDQEIISANNPPPLDIFNPVYNYTALVNPRTTNLQNSQGKNDSLSFNDHIKLWEDKIQFVVGARYDKYRSFTDNRLTNVAGTRNGGSTWTYKGGVVWKPRKDFSVFYNYSETFNANFGANPDGSTFIPSYGVVNELGVKTALREGRITATVSIFDLELQNIIGLHPDPLQASLGFRVQQAKQVTKGVEGDIILNVVPGWDLMLSASTLDITLPSGLLPRNAPEQTASLWTRYKFLDGGLKGFVIGGGWNRQGKKPGEVANEIIFPAVATLDAFAQYHWRNYRFSLNVSNLTDKYYLARGVNRSLLFAGPERLIKLRVGYVF